MQFDVWKSAYKISAEKNVIKILNYQKLIEKALLFIYE